MFKQLLNFEVFYQLKQRAFPLFALLFLASGVFVGQQGFAQKGVNFNAVYQVYFHTSLFTIGSVFIVMFFAISAIIRDKQYNMEGLIYSSSLKKANYFWSRFLGTFVFSALAFSPFIIGYVFGNYFSDLDPERIASFQLITYLQPWLYIVLPNIFICSSIVFSVSTLSKNSTATYVSAVFVYMLYFISSIFLNSPLMAQATPASPESMAIAAIADPFGIAAFLEQTQYWTAFQKNTQLISFSGLFLANRLIWILFSIGILFTTYKLFSFRKISKKVKKQPKEKKENIQLVTYLPKMAQHNFKAQRMAFISLLKLELKSVFKSLPFIAVLLMWLGIVFSELYATVISGEAYGVSVYPFTNQLIDLIVDPLTIFSLILIIYYSAEIVWKERSINFNNIVDATPVKNWVFFTSKFFALITLPLLLITSGILICVIFQISLNYTNFEFNLYAFIYYHYGVQLVVFSMIALFVNSLVKNKYFGMGIFGLIVLLSLKSGTLGLEHPLTSLGFMPRTKYNNMDGFNGASNLFNHLSVYWLAFGLLLTFISFKIWNRGVVTNIASKLKQLKNDWTTIQKTTCILSLLLFIGAGGLVFYNTNMLSDYKTKNDQLDYSENYERKFKKYESLERPIRIIVKNEVAIYPKERRYTVKANQTLKNSSEQELSEIFITERIPLENVKIENAHLVNHDKIYGTYLFLFDKPLQPNDSVKLKYEIKKELKGYDEDNSIVENGTYINKFNNFEPILGYSSGLEITNKIERQKRNLPKRLEEDNSDAHMVLEDFNFEKIKFETIISTDNDQTAISSGRLIREWSEDNRNYFHYKSTNKIMPAVGYFSAKYKIQKTNYKGVTIELYYDESHEFNINNIENSIKQTLDYCQENFGPYYFDHVRIAEVPSHWPFGGFAHPGVISMVEDRLYLIDVSNKETFDLVAKRTIHEVAHQWWGHTLSAKPVAGGSIFVEGFAKYTEAVVMEKMYGKGALYTLSEDVRARYFTGRAFDGDIEPPVYKVDNQSYISYGKALTVMLALRDLIGEKKVNKVIRTITDRNRNTNKLSVTTIELLDEIYKVTPTEYLILIDDWFKKVITYDIGIKNYSYKVLANGNYQVSIQVKANRYITMDSGETNKISINEPIKIGVFTKHPSKVKDDNSILYYNSSNIDKEFTEIKIIVNKKPSYVSIDPYGTRSDNNLVDNTRKLQK
ncbi:ABC transporter permease/M1 family aminopeptidase [Xanthomarina sp. GH4-25]|uniref:ABC transporter permease/M1 family aminopeptidase n=1 Tax=Xanthomarina sp. GH4-25 TaxID=3349335 RepID=UPI003877E678